MTPASQSTFDVGPYTIRITLRPDNPAWPHYLIFKGAKLIGKQFSYPSLSDCRALEHRLQERVAPAPEPYKRRTLKYGTGVATSST